MDTALRPEENKLKRETIKYRLKIKISTASLLTPHNEAELLNSRQLTILTSTAEFHTPVLELLIEPGDFWQKHWSNCGGFYQQSREHCREANKWLFFSHAALKIASQQRKSKFYWLQHLVEQLNKDRIES